MRFAILQKEFSADRQSVKLFLDQVLKAEQMKTDRLEIILFIFLLEISSFEERYKNLIF